MSKTTTANKEEFKDFVGCITDPKTDAFYCYHIYEERRCDTGSVYLPEERN